MNKHPPLKNTYKSIRVSECKYNFHKFDFHNVKRTKKRLVLTSQFGGKLKLTDEVIMRMRDDKYNGKIQPINVNILCFARMPLAIGTML